jgi:hypothetical protein
MKELEIRDYFFDRIIAYGLKYGIKELTVELLRIDIFAIGQDNTPYIIEFKKTKDKHIVGQAAQYLSLVPVFKKQIEHEINFYEVKWENLQILCLAPGFYERDFTAYKYDPLKGKIHFYECNALENNSKQVAVLDIEYLGPEKNGPLLLPHKTVDKNNLVEIRNECFKYQNLNARREYFIEVITPIFNEIGNRLFEYQNIGLYKHDNLLCMDRHDLTCGFYEICFSNNKSDRHGATIKIKFFQDEIHYGFDLLLTDSFYEAKKLSEYLKDTENCKRFVKKTLEFEDYYLLTSDVDKMPNIIYFWDKERLESFLKSYDPEKDDSCRFRIMKHFEKRKMFENDAIDIIRHEYKAFRYIFDIVE